MGEKITGFHAIEEALKTPNPGSTLFLVRGKDADQRLKNLENLAKANGKTFVKRLSESELDRLVPEGTDHRGAVLDSGASKEGRGGSVKNISVKDYCASLKPDDGALVLILDGITDPHNIGAILRSCDQFGCGLLVVPQRRSASVNETVLRISSGAARYVPIATVVNLIREIDTLKENGFWVYGSDMNGTSASEIKFAKRTAIVMGSEGDGMSRLVASTCDQIVSIPMQGHIDSLNVSVAAGILMYEFRRAK
ncbi:MAG: 23S rRNA (guanosine(2251)-2'-O)-methyltransferase RlmB [Sphaerochaetaceae bacterium]|jgi:23S rRNA (guanosine2251-2'-O)-methyltransferase|nr:23S rRNA (guanosine(2251)-2'-O)-methyltransferase RlmB [Sphaerochaetaceae bacterium]MDD3162909.1 23S rRNA (guanosine(2251)-2'-O)-methyltransferase RlmB [Sphaerochaetaceae bacterium]MDD4006470.1 23S rRNA (guanosine(2251)-2'-O)-methyltransferase RlmB [Sphaerochaetaceae bacterium]